MWLALIAGCDATSTKGETPPRTSATSTLPDPMPPWTTPPDLWYPGLMNWNVGRYTSSGVAPYTAQYQELGGDGPVPVFEYSSTGPWYELEYRLQAETGGESVVDLLVAEGNDPLVVHQNAGVWGVTRLTGWAEWIPGFGSKREGAVGDPTGDGELDLVLPVRRLEHGYGAWLLRGPEWRTGDVPADTAVITGSDDAYVRDVAVTDLTGDGNDDVFLWAFVYDQATVHAGPIEGVHYAEDGVSIDVSELWDKSNLWFASFPAEAGDLDADGYDDLALTHDATPNLEAAFGYLGPFETDRDRDDWSFALVQDTVVAGGVRIGQVPRWMKFGHLDEDTHLDLVFEFHAGLMGDVGVVYGPLEGVRYWSEAHRLVKDPDGGLPTTGYSSFGSIADINLDGADDITVITRELEGVPLSTDGLGVWYGPLCF
jgi:hypothetical protein